MLVKSSSPHVFADISREKIMGSVLIALIPVVISGIYFFGIKALILLGVTLVSTLIIDLSLQKISGVKFNVFNPSSYITSILLYLTLPPTVPFWIPPVGIFVALSIKYMFGRGNSIFNPALVGRAFLVVSWPALMTTWIWPDGVTEATPLASAKAGVFALKMDMFLGNIAGTIGETSALAIIIGGLFLIFLRYIDYKIPLVYIGGVFILSAILGHNPLYQILGGGLMLGAFFMATDYVTTPITRNGKIVFAAGCAILTVIFRFYSSMAEGVMFSILLMNSAAPIIQRYTLPKPFGYKKIINKRDQGNKR